MGLAPALWTGGILCAYTQPVKGGMLVSRRNRRVSLGSLLMLALAAAVLVLCAAFVLMIAPERRGAHIEQSLLPLQQATGAGASPAPTAAAAAADLPEQGAEQPSVQPAPAPTASSFTLAAAGTVYAPKAIRESAMEGAEHYDFAPVFEGLGTALSDADLSIVTLETTTAGESKGYGSYNTPPQILDALRAAGADLVSLATERALDKGYDGLSITVSELTARGLTCAGVTQEGTGRARVIGVNGIQVAVLAATYGISDEGRERTREAERGVLCLLETQQMVEDIRAARAAGADVVIVLPHWGTKNKAETPAAVKKMAATLAEAGADIILGTHPNVVQGTERLRVTRSDALEYETVVCYSLGSLLTDARAAENTAGMIARLTVSYDPVSRRTSLGELVCMPVYIARDRKDAEVVYRVVDTDNAAAVSALSPSEQEAARAAASLVREATGQSAREQEGQG